MPSIHPLETKPDRVTYELFPLSLPTGEETRTLAHLAGSAQGLAAAQAVWLHAGISLLVTADNQTAWQLEQELRFFLSDAIPVVHLEDWETLPYDVFSPHDDIISQRLDILNRLQQLSHGVLVVPISTLLHRLAPPEFIHLHSLQLEQGQHLNLGTLRCDLEANGYRAVSQVMSHGEFVVRGEIIDLYPMGRNLPIRIDLFDNEIETLREFDPETQRSLTTTITHAIFLMPGHEFPLDESAIKNFRRRYRERFKGDPQISPIYRGITQGNPPGGIEYYLPLFFEQTATLFDYLASKPLFIQTQNVLEAAQDFLEQAAERYEQLRHNRERPLLSPAEIFLTQNELEEKLKHLPNLRLLIRGSNEEAGEIEASVQVLPPMRLQPRAAQPLAALCQFVDQTDARILFCAESAGHRETLVETLRSFGLYPKTESSWQTFLEDGPSLAVTVAPLHAGMILEKAGVVIITENELLGERPRQHPRNRRTAANTDAIIRNLTDLVEGAPVVHEEHGVGRYRGLVKLDLGGTGHATEFLAIEYAGGDKLYVPVASLHLMSRYTGAASEGAPLHRLGSDQWQRLRKRAAEKVADVAAELLEINARRAARKGLAFTLPREEYAAFATAFPFEETPDQQSAIDVVLSDLAIPRPMDRVICGDVGFGKTEVALRAAFVVVQNGYQVAVLVPTTLLAEQHLNNFRDRFADWPVRIESLSRFRRKSEQQAVLEALRQGTLDIVIGTHKLLTPGIHFKRLGLAIIDEEHRFGVRHKEHIKQLRAEVDLLTLTATPIPRTLNMSLSGLRDLSIIATPPPRRHPIKTFVHEWDDRMVIEACARELGRGGQVYFLHNKVKTIERTRQYLQKLLPEARIGLAHGQMRERELEQVMLDFYHRRHDILVVTTIIESGIDIPNANTIIIDRADKLGLAQLHQLRGRVGRSHHRAYAYLITPPRKAMTADVVKRLNAIEALGDLGVGFSLATHDLEIRGSGELLGKDQSGQIQEIGFTLYQELLERAIAALKVGKLPELDRPLDRGAEIDLGVSALLPDDYVTDVHIRLILYKRIASAAHEAELRELQIELIDRFGLLPRAAKNLFEITRLKLKLTPIGVRKLDAGAHDARVIFSNQTPVNPTRLIRLLQCDPDRFHLDGQYKLRVHQDMPTFETRIQMVEALIGSLREKEG